MAIDKKGLGVVLAGLAVGAAQYLKKPENREKAMDMLNQSKTKFNGLVDQGKGAAQQFSSSEGTLKEKLQDATSQFKTSEPVTNVTLPELPIEDSDTSHAAKFSEDRMIDEGPQNPAQYFNDSNDTAQTDTNHTRHTDM